MDEYATAAGKKQWLIPSSIYKNNVFYSKQIDDTRSLSC